MIKEVQFLIYGIIYKATFSNGKSYIGQTTKELEQRKKGHLQTSKRKKDRGYVYPFYCAIRKYGWEDLTWEIIDTAEDPEELDEKEIYWIEYYHTYINFSNSNGYNLTLGGASVRRFPALNEKELYQCGLDIKKGLSKKEVQEKYNLNDSLYLRITHGLYCRKYTKIPKIDYHIDEFKSTLTRYQVDKILLIFKKTGRMSECAKAVGVEANTVARVIKGQSWSNYTGILDDSFFKKYYSYPSRFIEDIPLILQLNEQGKSREEISKITKIERSNIDGILSGRTLWNLTGIQRVSKEELMERGEMPNAKLSKESVLKIIEESKAGKSGKEISKDLNIESYTIYNILNGKTWEKFTKIERVTLEEKKEKAPIVSKLKLEQVLEIVEWSKAGVSQTELGEIYGVSKNTISSILMGKTWGRYTGIKYKGKVTNSDGGYKITHNDVDNILKLYSEGKTKKEISKELNIRLNLISDITLGKRWSSYTGIEYKPTKRKKNQ